MNLVSDEPVFIGLGSNLANPAEQISIAFQCLSDEPAIELQQQSSLYRSPPWGDLDQAEFVNAVARISTRLTPSVLLAALKKIEQAMGREHSGRRWGPRIIDLDLLAFGGRILSTDALQLPHPRIVERAFVLVPFAEIAADFQLPGLGRINQLLTRCDDAGTIRRLNCEQQDV